MINYDGPRRSGKSNRIIRRAMIEAAKGKKVLVISFSEPAAHFLFGEASNNYRDKTTTYRHADRTILVGRGTVSFRSVDRPTTEADVVFIDEYQAVLRKMFGNVQAIAGTTMKAEMKTMCSKEQLAELRDTMTEEQFKQEFVCTFKED